MAFSKHACLLLTWLTVFMTPFNAQLGRDFPVTGLFSFRPFVIGHCPTGYWTRWFDQHTPEIWDGDEIERFSDIKAEYEICPFEDLPWAIEVRTVVGNFPYWEPGNEFHRIDQEGVECYDEEQPISKPCQDYKVRFCCTPPSNDVTGVIGVCLAGHWTRWFNEDSPRNDLEIFSEIQFKYSICPDERRPMAIEVRTVKDNKPYWWPMNKFRLMDPRGVECREWDQSEVNPCKDYKVRFCCRALKREFTGVVGGPCQLYHYWTSWTSKDTPEEAGDFEPRGYVCGGAKPIAIQVRRIVDRAAYDSTNNLVKISVDSGFFCFNAEQPAENWRCDDFEVSYCCPLFLLPQEAS